MKATQDKVILFPVDRVEGEFMSEEGAFIRFCFKESMMQISHNYTALVNEGNNNFVRKSYYSRFHYSRNIVGMFGLEQIRTIESDGDTITEIEGRFQLIINGYPVVVLNGENRGDLDNLLDNIENWMNVKGV